jgi:hypothetical protein
MEAPYHCSPAWRLSPRSSVTMRGRVRWSERRDGRRLSPFMHQVPPRPCLPRLRGAVPLVPWLLCCSAARSWMPKERFHLPLKRFHQLHRHANVHIPRLDWPYPDSPLCWPRHTRTLPCSGNCRLVRPEVQMRAFPALWPQFEPLCCV